MESTQKKINKVELRNLQIEDYAQLAHIEKTQKKMKYNSISKNYGNTLKPQDGGLHL